VNRLIQVTHLFLDIGGVLLTNGWDHHARKAAAAHFGIAHGELETRHHLNFGVMEEGKLSLDDYLARVVFHKKRSFTLKEFQSFIFDQSKACPQFIEHLLRLKSKYQLRVIALSNESREINAYRIKKFNLAELIDFFISSCYVKTRKPDTEIYSLALNLSQAKASQALYIENTPLFVEVAEQLGISSILHENEAATLQKLASFGIKA